MKKRLDILIFEKGYAKSREEAKRLILSGNVFVSGRILDKVGMLVDKNSEIEIKEKFPYVSRGALKLEKAYQEFELDFKNKVMVDIGASTGGFTDFVLQHGAKKVYAIDAGYGQLDQKLRSDHRVINMERTNIRDLDSWEKFSQSVILATSTKCRRPESNAPTTVIPELCHEVGNIRNSEPLIDNENSWIPAFAGMTKKREEKEVEPIDIFTIDVSFISLKQVLPVVRKLAASSQQSAREKQIKNLPAASCQLLTEVVTLIKPQFEVGKKVAGKYKGVIKDEAIQNEVVEDIEKFAKELGFDIKGLTDSPILGAKGNKEYLIYLISNS